MQNEGKEGVVTVFSNYCTFLRKRLFYVERLLCTCTILIRTTKPANAITLKLYF